MVTDEICPCCGQRFRRNDDDYGSIDYEFCPDCADNKVYGAECGHDSFGKGNG